MTVGSKVAAAIMTLVALMLIASTAYCLDAREIMRRVEDRDRGDNMSATIRMTLIDKGGGRREREIKTLRKDFGPDTYQIMFFLRPSDVKGTSFLTYDYDDPAKDDDQWLYLPALKKTKRIASSDKSGSFMGSDFNYSDMTTKEVEDYKYQLLKEQDVGGHKCWLIEATPASRAVEDESGYSKSVLFVRQDNYVVVRAALWVSGSDRVKYMEVRELASIEGVWMVLNSTMTLKQGKSTLHSTELVFEGVRFGETGLSAETFTVRRMEQGL